MKQHVQTIQLGGNKLGVLMRIAKRHADIIVQEKTSNQLARIAQYCVVCFVFEKQLHQIFAQTIFNKKLTIRFAQLTTGVYTLEHRLYDARVTAESAYFVVVR